MRRQRFAPEFGVCWFGLCCLLLFSACAGGGSSARDERAGEQATGAIGSVGLGLSLPERSETQRVQYQISRHGGEEVRRGTIEVGPDGRATATIAGLQAGDGYVVVLTAERPSGAACRGEAAFSILPRQTTGVDVMIACDDLSPDTAVSIAGSFNVCPGIHSSSLTPLTVAVGSSASLTVVASDRDQDALSYLWSAQSGSFAQPNAEHTSYTCAAPGEQSLVLTVSDARGCTKTLALAVHCVAADGGSPDGGQADGGDNLARIQILGFNDFHGNIEPPSGSSGSVVTGRAVDGGAAPSVAAGGAAFFAQHIAALRAENPNTVVVSAGDLIGASPLVSALFHDEPTIEAMNLIGLDINGVGNHEFDEGRDELLRMQSGGCHPQDGCQDGTPFSGATFNFLSANVVSDPATGATLFDRYAIRGLCLPFDEPLG